MAPRLMPAAALAATLLAAQAAQACDVNDAHFHSTNYVQEGITPAELIKLMGDKVCRSTLFGIPLQQQWSYRESGDLAPEYYLEADAPLYYYSFTDAAIATAYRKLPAKDQARLDPMITGFNPADMYAADHVRRVLTTFPGVFTGIGEFSVHKEFVSPKIAGGGATLNDPALDRLLDFAGETGLVVILHNDIVRPFAKEGKVKGYFEQLTALYAEHPETTIIWAHMGLGRVVTPVPSMASYLEEILADPAMKHVYFDISWDLVARYLVQSEATTTVAANLINRYPDRFLYGSDVVAPRTDEAFLVTYELYAPLWKKLTPATREKVLKGNYERIFDAARTKVRAWEAANVR